MRFYNRGKQWWQKARLAQACQPSGRVTEQSRSRTRLARFNAFHRIYSALVIPTFAKQPLTRRRQPVLHGR